jgi:hypothetical protein
VRSQSCEKWLLASSRLYAWNSSNPTNRIFMKCYIWMFFEDLSRKFMFHQNLTRIACALKEGLCTFTVISRRLHLRIGNISDKFVEKIKTHILCSIMFFRKSCRLWDNVNKYGRTRLATDGSTKAEITKTTDTRSESVLLIAFPRQQWLRERASVLLSYVHCLSCLPFPSYAMIIFNRS